MLRARFLVSALVALAACGTPQERCIRTATSELQKIDTLIAEVEGNLARGYGYKTVYDMDTEFTLCTALERMTRPGHSVSNAGVFCTRDVMVERQEPVSIDPAAEKRKLDALKARRAALVKSSAAAVSQCKSTYPE